MCDDELIPPSADLTEEQWLRADPALFDGPVGERVRAMRAPRRRAVLGGAVAGAAALTVLSGAGRTPAAAAARSGRFPLPTAPNRNGEYAVLLTGDAGTGEEAQHAVAAAAREVCRAEGVGLAVGLGDNIYENGPESADDSEFRTKFEEPNTGLDMPWLMVLGNHDCSGLIPGSGGDPSRGDREVAYAKGSRRWHMPSRYYDVALPAAGEGGPLVEFFAIDTNPVSSYVAQLDPHYRWNGPYMREQRAWLDGALKASRARWKVVLGHHPYLNNGKHGSAGSYDGFTIGDYTSGVHLKELYEEVVCGRADLILSGHDHTLQMLEPTSRTGGTRQIVCGAAGKAGDGRAHYGHPASWQNFADHGFMVLKASDRAMTVDAYTVDVPTRTARLAHSVRTSSPLGAAASTAAPGASSASAGRR
ncbi:calcineurin [Streptomyces alfalfae]|uniref:Calcineurin n=1 Tax=Streptomyces alfalfae TaxID=1642299 RepID=A0ABM6GMU5_9ACTN|nr:metallophosphoesterase [Streptomyces alfalfae]APY85095.1 calcineurin [Streptomyces alfalfae]AYA15435.1 calcineurin [Streptomyces fradiae]RXX43901.1 calcineurin [Streptomyces alfalfae]RZM91330.1 calcineurin [Streptomyces alfalfae]